MRLFKQYKKMHHSPRYEMIRILEKTRELKRHTNQELMAEAGPIRLLRSPHGTE